MWNLLRSTVGKKCLTDHTAQNKACTVKPETQQINFCLSPENNAATIYYTILNKKSKNMLVWWQDSRKIFRSQQDLESDNSDHHYF